MSSSSRRSGHSGHSDRDDLDDTMDKLTIAEEPVQTAPPKSSPVKNDRRDPPSPPPKPSAPLIAPSGVKKSVLPDPAPFHPEPVSDFPEPAPNVENLNFFAPGGEKAEAQASPPTPKPQKASPSIAKPAPTSPASLLGRPGVLGDTVDRKPGLEPVVKPQSPQSAPSNRMIELCRHAWSNAPPARVNPGGFGPPSVDSQSSGTVIPAVTSVTIPTASVTSQVPSQVPSYDPTPEVVNPGWTSTQRTTQPDWPKEPNPTPSWSKNPVGPDSWVKSKDPVPVSRPAAQVPSYPNLYQPVPNEPNQVTQLPVSVQSITGLQSAATSLPTVTPGQLPGGFAQQRNHYPPIDSGMP